MRAPDGFLYAARDGRPELERAERAGYAALIASYDLDVPLPATIFGIGARHRVTERPGLRLLTPRHAPPPTLEGHLTFALKYEGVNPAVLKALFHVIDPELIADMVRAKPTGGYVRRIWFLYEWLTGRTLDLPPLRRGSYVNLANAARGQTAAPIVSRRHRVRNNAATNVPSALPCKHCGKIVG